jgi:hypothetical protein
VLLTSNYGDWQNNWSGNVDQGANCASNVFYPGFAFSGGHYDHDYFVSGGNRSPVSTHFDKKVPLRVFSGSPGESVAGTRDTHFCAPPQC